jgi:hypothetical protein
MTRDRRLTYIDDLRFVELVNWLTKGFHKLYLKDLP